MSIPQKSSTPVLDYYPAQISKGKVWYVYFYAWNPATESKCLKRIKLMRIKSVQERLRYARKLQREINIKLENGWSPFIEAKASRAFVPLLDALYTYQNHTFKDLESNSIRSYKSFISALVAFIEKENKTMYCHNFDSSLASKFILHLNSTKKLTTRTFNNYVAFYKNLFSWLCEYEYVPVNPFEKIRKKKVDKRHKNRVAFTRTELKELFTYLEKTNMNYCIICQLIYYCLLRPDDVVKLTSKQFNFDNHTIAILSENTKNDNDSYRTIPKHLDRYLIDILQINTIPLNHYIFSENKTFTPGLEILDPRELSRYWAKNVRPAMEYDLTKKLYSLKDTGITNMMSDGVSPAFVQHQADHSSIEVTSKYIHNDLPEGWEQLRNNVKSVF